MNSRLLLTTLAISAAAAAPAAAKPADVNVVNTVSVAGIVGLDPAANGVTVTNEAPIPVAVAQPHAPAERVVLSHQQTIPAGEGVIDVVLYEVPAGKRFETEFVQAVVSPRDDQVGSASLITRYQGDHNALGLLPLEQGPDTPTVNTPWRFAAPFVAVSDSTVQYVASRIGGTEGTATTSINVVGRLVDASAPAS